MISDISPGSMCQTKKKKERDLVPNVGLLEAMDCTICTVYGSLYQQ